MNKILLGVVFSVALSGSAQAAAADKSTDATVNFQTVSGIAAHAPDASHQSVSATASCSAGSGSCSLSWNGLLAYLAGDIVHVEFPSGTVSLPSSVLLFGPGLLGLTIVARRRNALPN